MSNNTFLTRFKPEMRYSAPELKNMNLIYISLNRWQMNIIAEL